MRLLLAALMILSTKAATGADNFEVEMGTGPNPWSHLNFEDRPDTFQFAIVSDRTGGMRPGVFEKAVEKLNLLRPAFVMSIGDLIEGNTADEAVLQAQWEEFHAIIEPLNAPFFHVPGNHDVSNTTFGTQEWKKRLGRLYYHFVYKNTLFLCLNSDDEGLNRIGDAQFHYIETALKERSEVRWTFVFMHKPLWATDEAEGWERVEALLAVRPHTVFTGHTHQYLKYERQGRDYFILGTTGAGMSHAGIPSGEFDHIVWVTMGDEGPVFANLLLDGILDKDVRTSAKAMLSAPLLEGRATPPPRITCDSTTFTHGDGEIRLVNSAAVPLIARGQLEPSAQLTPSLTYVERTLPPMSETAIPLHLSATSPQDVRSLQPLVVRWMFVFSSDATGHFEVPYATHVHVETTFPLPTRKHTPTLDGNLDEWDVLPYFCLEPAETAPPNAAFKGTADCSFRFNVLHDSERFYCAVQVTDEAVHLNAVQGSRKQDHVLLRLAPFDHEGASEEGVTLAFAPDTTSVAAVWVGRPPCPEGVEAASTRCDGGYMVEVSLPRVLVEGVSRSESGRIKLNVGVKDVDSAFDTGVTLWWRPDWDGTLNAHDFGIFALVE